MQPSRSERRQVRQVSWCPVLVAFDAGLWLRKTTFAWLMTYVCKHANNFLLHLHTRGDELQSHKSTWIPDVATCLSMSATLMTLQYTYRRICAGTCLQYQPKPSALWW